MKQLALVALIMAALITGACGSKPDANMANPASEFCTEQGGKWESRTEAGGEVGYCILEDGTECEEWAYYRGQCGPDATMDQPGMANPASVYCGEQGGKTEIRTEAGGEVGYCLFDDGSECEEWAYFRGDCAPGE